MDGQNSGGGGSTPLGFAWGRAAVPALSPHTARSCHPLLLAPAVVGSRIRPQTPGERARGARLPHSQQPPPWLEGCSVLYPKSTLLDPRSHFPCNVMLQFPGASRPPSAGCKE